ncbi:MAG: hypothetical protein HC929_17890 [Leptolyngbyaceae cyanobacterium SM2_5_2]|nr:hypothetical protein [Leptolyngbyaceae cyanobacterium SM2_5_2]
MARPDLIEQARQGNTAAIAQLITDSLASQGVVALVSWQGPVLHVALETDQPLNPATTVPLIRRGFHRLGMTCPLDAVELDSRQAGYSEPVWRDRFSLTPGPGPSPQSRSAQAVTPQLSSPPQAMAAASPAPEPQATPTPYLTDTTLAALAHLSPLVGYLMMSASWITGIPSSGEGLFCCPGG